MHATTVAQCTPDASIPAKKTTLPFLPTPPMNASSDDYSCGSQCTSSVYFDCTTGYMCVLICALV